jgi:hypothetical protein
MTHRKQSKDWKIRLLLWSICYGVWKRPWQMLSTQASQKKVDEVEPTPDLVEARENTAILEGKQHSSLVDTAEWKKVLKDNGDSTRGVGRTRTPRESLRGV